MIGEWKVDRDLMKDTYAGHAQRGKQLVADRDREAACLLTDLDALAEFWRVNVLRHGLDISAALNERVGRV